MRRPCGGTPVSQIQGRIAEVIPEEQFSERILEQIVDVPVRPIEENLKGNFEAGDKKKAVRDASAQWDKNRLAEKDEFEAIDAYNGAVDVFVMTQSRHLAVRDAQKTVVAPQADRFYIVEKIWKTIETAQIDMPRVAQVPTARTAVDIVMDVPRVTQRQVHTIQRKRKKKKKGRE